jgi:hypothetical protein
MKKSWRRSLQWFWFSLFTMANAEAGKYGVAVPSDQLVLRDLYLRR